MIEVTEAAANMIARSLVEGKVIRMFLAAIDASGASYGLALGEEEEGDQVFESRGVKIYMSTKDAELLNETIIDYVDDEERGTGFIIRGPEDEISGCGSCANADSCDHDHSSCDHDHDHEGCGCGCG
ncbi:MAG: HesB/IscA family protein [Methanothrix sp.]